MKINQMRQHKIIRFCIRLQLVVCCCLFCAMICTRSQHNQESLIREIEKQKQNKRQKTKRQNERMQWESSLHTQIVTFVLTCWPSWHFSLILLFSLAWNRSSAWFWAGKRHPAVAVTVALTDALIFVCFCLLEKTNTYVIDISLRSHRMT